MVIISVRRGSPEKSQWTERIDQVIRKISETCRSTFTRKMRCDHIWRCEKWWQLQLIWNWDLTLPKHIKRKWYVLKAAPRLKSWIRIYNDPIFADWKYVDNAWIGKTYRREYRIFVGWSEKTFGNCTWIDQQSARHILGWTNYVSCIPMTSIAVACHVFIFFSYRLHAMQRCKRVSAYFFYWI